MAAKSYPTERDYTGLWRCDFQSDKSRFIEINRRSERSDSNNIPRLIPDLNYDIRCQINGAVKGMFLECSKHITRIKIYAEFILCVDLILLFYYILII